jgi:hypothetical protein
VAANGARGSRSRRVRLPGLSELVPPARNVTADQPTEQDQRQVSGRETHTHKITVYLSADELLDLEHARLELRGYGIAADRGRLVREAIALMLADLDAQGASSRVARRLDRKAETD